MKSRTFGIFSAVMAVFFACVTIIAAIAGDWFTVAVLLLMLINSIGEAVWNLSGDGEGGE